MPKYNLIKSIKFTKKFAKERLLIKRRQLLLTSVLVLVLAVGAWGFQRSPGIFNSASALVLPTPPGSYKVNNVVLDKRTPNGTWKLYSGNFQTGQQIRADWFGLSHLDLELFDRLTNLPIQDSQGKPVAKKFSGTLSFTGWNSMSLTIPTLSTPQAAKDAILVVKNPDAYTGQIVFNLYTPNTLTLVPAPAPIVPKINITDKRNGLAYVSYQVADGGTLPAYGIQSAISYQTATSTTPTMILSNNLRGYAVAAGTTATDTFTMPITATRVAVQLSNTTYGQKFVVTYNFIP